MKIVFFGTPKFAADILKSLLYCSNHEICAVVTSVDAIRKRGNQLEELPVAKVGHNSNLNVLKPETLRSEDTIEQLKSLQADIFCVAAYGQIFPKSVLDIPKFGCINVHASLLPKWRGAAPIERAILAGDKLQGVSIMQMEEGMDTGAFCIQMRAEADGFSQQEMRDKLSLLGAEALIQALSLIEDGRVEWQVQNDDEATYANKILKSDVLAGECLSKIENVRRVLASGDSYPCKCEIDGRVVRILCAQNLNDVADGDVKGKVVARGKRLFLGCRDGFFEVKFLKPDGKKEMSAESFIAGSQRIKDGIAFWKGIDN